MNDIGICESCLHIFECPYLNGKRALPSNDYPGGDGCIEVINSVIVDCVEHKTISDMKDRFDIILGGELCIK